MPRVILLHGLGADRHAFQRFSRLLPASWEAVAHDLLGHGDAPKPAHGYSLEEHAAYIAGVLEPVGPVVLVGHSYGAATAVAVAARHPHTVRGIILLDPITHLGDAPLGQATLDMMDARRNDALDEVVPRLFPLASAALQRWTIDTWRRMALGVIDEFDPHWTRFTGDVHCPVAIVHGQLELGGGGDLAADFFDEPLVIGIEDAGHYLHATHAREVAAAVRTAVEHVIEQ